MAPGRLHYFYARGGPSWLWLGLSPLVAVLATAYVLGPAPELAWTAEARGYAFLIAIAWAIAFCVAALAGVFLLGPLYRHRARVNGAPFHAGDRVLVLAGRHRGKRARVEEVWEYRGTLRVAGGEMGDSRPIVLGFCQVLKQQ